MWSAVNVIFFDITLYFYNPNIVNDEEYSKRANELIRLVEEMGLNDRVKVIIKDFNNREFYEAAKGFEKEPERGKRCEKCFKLRLEDTAEYASQNNYDYFTTTLTISPHKDAVLINNIGNFLKGLIVCAFYEIIFNRVIFHLLKTDKRFKEYFSGSIVTLKKKEKTNTDTKSIDNNVVLNSEESNKTQSNS